MFKKKVIVEIILKNGAMAKYKFDESQLSNLERVFKIVDQAWMEGKDGVLELKADHVRMQEIVAYSLKIKRW